MEKSKKIKIILGIFYLVFICLFLYFFFSYFDLKEINSIKIIQSNADKLNELKSNNLFLMSIFFFLFTVLWVFLHLVNGLEL